jgi:hypothetical protein
VCLVSALKPSGVTLLTVIGATRQTMRVKPYTLISLSLLVGVICTAGAQDHKAVVSLTEAKILIFVSPIAEEVRKKGMDIGVELQTSSQLNQADYYHFWVYNNKRTHSDGSVTIGYYAVSKYTGDVWNDTSQRVSGKLLGDIQTILRKEHGIEESTVKRYQSSPP